MKNVLYINQAVIKNAISGFIVGFLFPILSIIIDLSIKDLSLSWINIRIVFSENLLQWVILGAPLVFAVGAYVFTILFHKKINEMTLIINEENLKSRRIQEFAEKIRRDEFDAQFITNEENDKIATSLIELRDYLRKNKEEENQRKKEDAQRNWATEGLAKFGEILRENNDDIEILSFNIIKNLVQYVGANQGGFFITNDRHEDDKHFEMSSCYAFNRRKYLKKRIEWGEGLVGTCGLDMQTIFLTDVPDEYIEITSGLGDANPRCLILVPLIASDKVHGVLELASFKIFEPFEVEFIEKLAESIASTISSVKINLQTAVLLKETQEQTEKMRMQEEQMRQNMEELQATQEEAAKQGELLSNFTNSVNHTMIRAEYSSDGTLLYANTKFLEKMGYASNKEIEGKNISAFIHERDRLWFNQIWESLSSGGQHFEGDMKHVTRQGKDFWSISTYTCVRNSYGNVEKILFLGIDTTEQKKLSLDHLGQINALNNSTIKAEFSTKGALLSQNEKFMDAFGYNVNELKNKTVFDFLFQKDIDGAKQLWKQVIKGIPYEGQARNRTKESEEKWFQVTYTAVKDMYGDLSKVVFIANDITQQKKMEQEIKMVKIRNEKILEGALDAIVTVSQLGIVDFFNTAAETLWGLKKEDVIGKSVKMLVPPEYAEKHDSFMENYLKTGQKKMIGKRTEGYILNKSGEKIPVLLTVAEAKIDNTYTFTAFIQNISVELF